MSGGAPGWGSCLLAGSRDPARDCVGATCPAPAPLCSSAPYGIQQQCRGPGDRHGHCLVDSLVGGLLGETSQIRQCPRHEGLAALVLSLIELFAQLGDLLLQVAISVQGCVQGVDGDSQVGHGLVHVDGRYILENVPLGGDGDSAPGCHR